MNKLSRKYTDMSAWIYQSPEETGTGFYSGKVTLKMNIMNVFSIELVQLMLLFKTGDRV